MQNTALIIAAAGQGRRMGAQMNKQFIEIDKTPILIHTLRRFEVMKDIGQVILVHHKDEQEVIQSLVDKSSLSMDINYVAGGESRQESIYRGLEALLPHIKTLIIHDGARPFVTDHMVEVMKQFIDRLALVCDVDGGFFGVPVKDTIKKATANGFETIDREALHAVQTPQIFNRKSLVKAHLQASHEGFIGTDDCSLIERVGGSIVVLSGDYKNIKVTTPEDLLIAEVFSKSI